MMLPKPYCAVMWEDRNTLQRAVTFREIGPVEDFSSILDHILYHRNQGAQSRGVLYKTLVECPHNERYG